MNDRNTPKTLPQIPPKLTNDTAALGSGNAFFATELPIQEAAKELNDMQLDDLQDELDKKETPNNQSY